MFFFSILILIESFQIEKRFLIDLDLIKITICCCFKWVYVYFDNEKTFDSLNARRIKNKTKKKLEENKSREENSNKKERERGIDRKEE